MSKNGNGYDPAEQIAESIIANQFGGAEFKVDGRQREDGVVTRLDQAQIGVLARMMTAIKQTDDYRQELKTGNWKDDRFAALAVAAIHERLMCGVDITPVVDRIIAESAGVNSARLQLVANAISSFSLNSNYGEQKKSWFNSKGKNGAANNTLLSQ